MFRIAHAVGSPRLCILPALLAALALAACQHPAHVSPKPQCDFRPVKHAALPQGPVLVPQLPGSVTHVPLNAVNITDVAITNKIMVQATNARRAGSGDVEVFARLVNCTDYPLQVEGRTRFLDAGQGDAEPVTAWRRVHLPARTLGSYSARSTAGAVVESYLIELREGQ